MMSQADPSDESGCSYESAVDFDSHNGWVFVCVVGQLAQHSIISVMRKARAVCESEDCYRILIDVRNSTIKTSFIEAYMVARKFSELTGLDQRFRCAFLYDARTYSRQRAETMTTITGNWDVTQICAFERFEDASEYLKR